MNIPSLYASNDTIYHFTKTQTAIEFILYDMQLRLTPRTISNDPIEGRKPFIHYSSIINPHDIKNDIHNKHNLEAKKIAIKLKARYLQNKMICFCMNSSHDKYDSYTVKPLEYYGFLKPRMWSQYGDNYKGICLAFSKSELLERNKNLIAKNIDYISYEDLSKSYNNIDINSLLANGYDVTLENIMTRTDKYLFQKHIDYTNENEFRICSFSNKLYDYINIKKSLKGIIISEVDQSDYSRNLLLNYAKKHQLDIKRISWKNSGVNLISGIEINFFEDKLSF